MLCLSCDVKKDDDDESRGDKGFGKTKFSQGKGKGGGTDTNWCLRVAVQAHMVTRICLYGVPPSLVQMKQLGKVKTHFSGGFCKVCPMLESFFCFVRNMCVHSQLLLVCLQFYPICMETICPVVFLYVAQRGSTLLFSCMWHRENLPLPYCFLICG